MNWVANLLGKPAVNPLPEVAPAPAPRPEIAASSPARDVVARLVPGTDLRDGIDRILRARTGALIVLGYDESIEQICDGGFDLDVEFSPTRLRELSKMDGAVVLSGDGGRIRRANVHLVPDPLVPTTETGTRHKAAERTAAQIGCPVVSVSRSTGIVTVYAHGSRHLIQPSETILARANQAMATLERYRSRLDEMLRQLSVVELGDVVTVRDVLTVVHCLELVRRVAHEIRSDVGELGVDGRQLALQLAEVVGDTDDVRRLIVRDYVRPVSPGGVEEALADRALDALDQLLEVELLELTNLAQPLGFPAALEALDTATAPRGYRLLEEIPRVPRQQARGLVAAFGSLTALLDADVADLAAVEGIDDDLARRIHEALARPH
ncbi:DNA integrity scanning diadenylate cyclase DisA [Nocardia pseudobrasiliensis]|uniref:Diadenylate cyclase n=1 Tax=Nocardia pseudobrasiliensis TaxID=45979 RepID=A0A370I5U8_9NOCA|nr:DNA integrity scanning diadenylate cyclase DisA [Nocardia pseudobrasiliensis]RDI66108.1 diadenylate cyclase [Nocardia pseudobrasiliensis]